MIKDNKILITVFLLLANILAVAGITVQAASLQKTMAGEIELNIDIPVRGIASEFQKKVEEIEMERVREAEELAKYNLELLASIIFCEAGNQSYKGQVAVGAVVMNRISSDKFPDTMEEVIYQSGQFVPAMTGWLDDVRAASGYTDSAMKAAKDALLGVNPIGDCLFFDQGGYGYQIGAHYFH